MDSEDSGMTTEKLTGEPQGAAWDRRRFLRQTLQATAATVATLIGVGESEGRSSGSRPSPAHQAAPGSAANSAARPRPNIIFIIADDLGWTDLSTGMPSKGNGSHYYQTPQIDRLASAGMSFTSAYAFQNCQPSRASLMTGQFAPHDGVYNVASLDRGSGVSLLKPPAESTRIRESAITVAKTLQSSGYVTAHVGKFHVSPNPQDIVSHFGFTYNYGGGVQGDGGPGGYLAINGPKRGWHFRNLGVGMDPFAAPYTAEYIAKNLQPYANGNDPKTLVGSPKHLTDADVDAAIEFIDRHRGGPDRDKPFFLNLAFNAVHVAIHARPDLAKKYFALKSTDPRHTRPGYAGLIEGMDQAVGRLLAHLDDPNGNGDRAANLASNTLIFFISDNGGFEGSTHNNPLRGGKGMFSDGGLRIPMIARYPGVIKAGVVTDALAHVSDLYPTAAAFAGAALPDPKVHVIDGVSLAGVLQGREISATGQSSLYWHFPGYLDTRAKPCSVIIKDIAAGKGSTKRYKLLYFYEDRHYEVYCLTDDIGEKTNQLAGKQPPTGATRALAQDLRDDLVGWLARVNPSYPTEPASGSLVPPPVPLDQARYGVPDFVGHTVGAPEE